ncbi:unnamed protein product [Pleuronectes platessa]|uniref:Uncharacterized protein n=1 Tax=Pleuronectes platessa TaxID=8262 RepID=A0A9N7YEQ8_PLEPL|nr:unnamed protein product [Pleuronectes platessa]
MEDSSDGGRQWRGRESSDLNWISSITWHQLLHHMAPEPGHMFQLPSSINASSSTGAWLPDLRAARPRSDLTRARERTERSSPVHGEWPRTRNGLFPGVFRARAGRRWLRSARLSFRVGRLCAHGTGLVRSAQPQRGSVYPGVCVCVPGQRHCGLLRFDFPVSRRSRRPRPGPRPPGRCSLSARSGESHRTTRVSKMLTELTRLYKAR